MSTYTWASPLPGIVNSPASVANFSNSFEELHGYLIEAGLEQTADNNQTDDIAMFSNPADHNFTAVANRVYKWDGVVPYYIRIEVKWWNSSNAAGMAPSFELFFGTETDGEGNLNSVNSHKFGHQTTGGSASQNGATTRSGDHTTYICSTDDFFGLIWKYQGGAGDNSYAPASYKATSLMFAMARSEQNDLLVSMINRGGMTDKNLTASTNKFKTSKVATFLTVRPDGQNFLTNRGSIAYAWNEVPNLDGNVPVFNTYHVAGDERGLILNPCVGVATRAAGEPTIFEMAMDGINTRTFINLPDALPFSFDVGTSANQNMVMLWE